MIKYVVMSVKSIIKAKRPIVVTILETDLKIITNVEVDLPCNNKT
jgi:hypothetical protein